MALKLAWTQDAHDSYKETIGYLKENWTDKEISNFVIETQKILEYILLYPKMFRAGKQKNVRIGFITKNISLFYQIKPRKKEITLLLFWDNRLNPAKNRY